MPQLACRRFIDIRDQKMVGVRIGQQATMISKPFDILRAIGNHNANLAVVGLIVTNELVLLMSK